MSEIEHPIEITLAICTYNRAECLEDSVSSCYAQETGFAFEVIVINNNSTDNTEEVIAELQQRYPQLRYVNEPKQGLSHGRNRALAEARGRIVSYIDDDCVTLAGWLQNVRRGFDEPGVACVGGRIFVGYPDGKKPAWIHHKLETYLGFYDRGPVTTDVDHIYGGNFNVLRSVALDLGGFSKDFGHQGGKEMGGEDTEFCIRARAAGYRVIYVPEAQVIHNPDPRRLKKEWFLKRALSNADIVAMSASELRQDLAAFTVQEFALMLLCTLLHRSDTAFLHKANVGVYKSALTKTTPAGFAGSMVRVVRLALATLLLPVRAILKLAGNAD